MRIGIDYTAGIHQGAGIGRIVREWVNELIAIDQSNQYVLFYAHSRQKRPEPPFSDRRNVQSRPLSISDRTLNIIWYRLGIPLPVDLFTGPVDVFHSPDFTRPPQRHGASVVTVHDLSFLMEPQCADERLRAFLEKVVPASVARADFVTADSANTRNDLIVLLDVPPDRVEVVYGGVDSRFRPINDAAALETVRSRYGLTSPFILYVGTIEPRKNLSRLLEAYRQLRAKNRVQHRLVLGGGLGWLYHDILQEIDELGSGHEVIYLGRIPDEDLPAIYNLADLFVFPSLYEGFGLPPLEAMACGTPVVCSNSSSLPEIVDNAALLTNPTDVDGLADAIAQALNEPELRADLIRRGIERAGQFTWEASARKLLTVYERAAKLG